MTWRRHRSPTPSSLCRWLLLISPAYTAGTLLSYVDSVQAEWWRRSLSPDLKPLPLWKDFKMGLRQLIGRRPAKSAQPAAPHHLPDPVTGRVSATAAAPPGGSAPVLSAQALWTLSFLCHAWARVGDLADTQAGDVYVSGTKRTHTVVPAYGAKEARRGRPPPRLVVSSSLLPSPLPPTAGLLLSPPVRKEILGYSASLGLTGHSWRVGAIRSGAPLLDLKTSQAKARHATADVHLRYLQHVLTTDQLEVGSIPFPRV